MRGRSRRHQDTGEELVGWSFPAGHKKWLIEKRSWHHRPPCYTIGSLVNGGGTMENGACIVSALIRLCYHTTEKKKEKRVLMRTKSFALKDGIKTLVTLDGALKQSLKAIFRFSYTWHFRLRDWTWVIRILVATTGINFRSSLNLKSFSIIFWDESIIFILVGWVQWGVEICLKYQVFKTISLIPFDLMP